MVLLCMGADRENPWPRGLVRFLLNDTPYLISAYLCTCFNLGFVSDTALLQKVSVAHLAFVPLPTPGLPIP